MEERQSRESKTAKILMLWDLMKPELWKNDNIIFGFDISSAEWFEPRKTQYVHSIYSPALTNNA